MYYPQMAVPNDFKAAPFESEDQFEQVLISNPDAFPIRELNPNAVVAVPIGMQVTTEVGPIDLLFLDNTGRLIIVECKLVENPEQRRQVVAQLQEYASRTSTWDAAKVTALAEEYAKTQGEDDLIGLFKQAHKRAGIDEHWGHEDRAALKKKIARRCGDPILVVAANRFEDRALVLVDYLRQQKMPIACVEVRRYVGEHGREIVFGFVKAAGLLVALSSGQRARVDEEEWLALAENEPLSTIRRHILEWAKQLAVTSHVRFGSKSLMLDVQGRSGKTAKVLEVEVERVWFYLKGFEALGWDQVQVRQFRSDIESIARAKLPEKTKEYPSLPLLSFAETGRLKALLERLAAAINTVAGDAIAATE
jgi:hypothetical protein